MNRKTTGRKAIKVETVRVLVIALDIIAIGLRFLTVYELGRRAKDDKQHDQVIAFHTQLASLSWRIAPIRARWR